MTARTNPIVYSHILKSQLESHRNLLYLIFNFRKYNNKDADEQLRSQHAKTRINNAQKTMTKPLNTYVMKPFLKIG